MRITQEDAYRIAKASQIGNKGSKVFRLRKKSTDAQGHKTKTGEEPLGIVSRCSVFLFLKW